MQRKLHLFLAVGLAAAFVLSTDALAAPPMKKIPTAGLKKGKATAVRLPTLKPGQPIPRITVAKALGIAETELGRETTLSIDRPVDGKSYMKLVTPRVVDPSTPRATFYSKGGYGKGFGSAVTPLDAVVELHFLAKAGKRYFVECDAARDDWAPWVLGYAKAGAIPSPLASTSEARPAFVYTATANGEVALHVLLDEGAWSARSCSITPQK